MFMNVPSFASFPDLEPEQAGPSKARPKSPARASGKTGEKSKRRKDDRERDKDGRRHRHRTPLPARAAEPESKLFYSDRKGDPLNISLGGLHSRAVPKYYRVGGVIGLPPRWNGEGKEFTDGDRYIFKHNLARTTRRLKPSSQPSPLEDPNADFLPFPSSSTRSSRGLLDIDPVSSPSPSSSRSASPEHLPLSANAALERRVKTDPTDLAAWHSLLVNASSSSPTPKAAAEIKLSVLSRALSHLPNSPTLLAARARLSTILQSSDEVNRLWEEAIAKARGEGRADVWKEWLAWVFRVKGIEEGVGSVARAMKACEIEDGTVLVELFGLACGILMNAGFTELAISAYQALLEAHFFRPVPLEDAPWPVVVQQLESWWDGEHRKVGELRYHGWGGQAADTGPASSAPPPANPDALIQSGKRDDAYSDWATAETRMSRDGFLPPASDVQDETDPYRITLFHDIAPLLPTRALSPMETALVAQDLLGLLGLGMQSRIAIEVSEVHVLDGWWEAWAGAKYLIGARAPLIRNILAQLRSRIRVADRDRWDQLWVAFEWTFGRKAALKLTKLLLSTSPFSLSLWSLHADLERLGNKPDAARKVYDSVLKVQSGKKPGEDQMWYDWARLEWEQGAVDKALEVICTAALGGEGSGPVRILRARQTLDARFTSTSTPEILTTRGLLSYLSSTSLADTIRVLNLEPGMAEPLHLARAKFLKSLVENRGGAPVPPNALRGSLEQSALLFPANAELLSIYAWNEKREKVWGRVKRLLETVMEAQGGGARLETWFGAVFSEETPHGKREWLDRAVRDDRIRGSVALWIKYVKLELEQGQAAKARSLLYRAVAECPWSKELHLLAFAPSLRTSFKPRELDSWIDVMLERGIRVRAEWTGSPEEEEDEEEDADEGPAGEADIEREFAERRRLMPY